MNTGLLSAALAFTTWGLFPLYFQFIADVPALEVVLHRSVWALVFVLGILAWQKRWAWLRDTLRQPRLLLLFTASALLLWTNWLVYVYAAQTGATTEKVRDRPVHAWESCGRCRVKSFVSAFAE